MKPKIAYIRKSAWPLANERLQESLKQAFPEYDVQTFDVMHTLLRNPRFVAINLTYILKEYGHDLLARRKKAIDCFLITTYTFRTIKRMMTRQLAAAEFDFSIQIQSLFDAASPYIPHFVYTDYTMLANLDHEGFNTQDFFGKGWMQLEPTIYNNAARIFTRSSNVSRSLIKYYNCEQQKVHCIYAGSNVAVQESSSERERYARKRILFVGLDWQRKGGPALLEAFKRVLQVHPDATLTIAGPKLDLDIPQCEFVGRLSPQELRTYYREASIFCLPTRHEPFGVAFIEALSYRLPVVATNIGAIPDFIHDGENGYLVEPDDVEHIADALIKLLDDPAKCQVFGNEGYRIATELYTWEKVGQRIREHVIPIVMERSLNI